MLLSQARSPKMFLMISDPPCIEGVELSSTAALFFAMAWFGLMLVCGLFVELCLGTIFGHVICQCWSESGTFCFYDSICGCVMIWSSGVMLSSGMCFLLLKCF
jgi:hypothetical protein